MTSILFLIQTIYCNIADTTIPERKYFLHLFFFQFWNLYSILNIFEKNMTFIADAFLNELTLSQKRS